MSLLWPRATKPVPTAPVRLGRLLHYASFLPAAYLAWLTWDTAANDPMEPHYVVVCLAAMALGALLVGRALRWALAGE